MAIAGAAGLLLALLLVATAPTGVVVVGLGQQPGDPTPWVLE